MPTAEIKPTLGTRADGAVMVLAAALRLNHRPLAEIVRYRNRRAYWMLLAYCVLVAGLSLTWLALTAPPGFPLVLLVLLGAVDAPAYIGPFVLLRRAFYKRDNAEGEKIVRAGLLLWLAAAALSAAAAALGLAALKALGLPLTPGADQPDLLIAYLPLAVAAFWTTVCRYVVMVRFVGFNFASAVAALASILGAGFAALLLV